MTSPYADLPSSAFWRSAVTDRAPLDPGNLYKPKFPMNRKMKVVTAGSCFAQHVGRALIGAGFDVQDAEPAPAGMTDATAQRFGYRLFSARYGNIYTIRQLVQLLDETEGAFQPANFVWEKDGRFFDAMRPGVEPEGLDSPEQVTDHRRHHLARVAEVFAAADLFVFTFGLTEAWIDRSTKTVYPTAPGTIAGAYDQAVHAFHNYGFKEVVTDFAAFRVRMMKKNPKMKFLVTVSPVPLTAAATTQHVEVATAYSKAVLRAATGSVAERFSNVDYFPSYEIITSTNNRGVYFQPNKRSVSEQGVRTAMSVFLAAHGMEAASEKPNLGAEGLRRRQHNARNAAAEAEEAICEEALLDAFAQ